MNLESRVNKVSTKFIRRSDLTPPIRFFIAFTLLATSLAVTSESVFGPSLSPMMTCDIREFYRYMLSFRLEGRCSIGAISTMMKRFGVKRSSVGTISQSVRALGACVPSTLSWGGDSVKLVVFLSDELFAKSRPILVTVDPQSSALLRVELSDTRKMDDWKRHWECLRDNGIQAVYLVSDEGAALTGAQKDALADVVWQPDTYHAIAHHLGKYVNLLEQAAETAARKVVERWKTLDSARSEAVMDTRVAQDENACRDVTRKSDRANDFSYLYHCLVGELRLFDTHGELRDRQVAEGNLEAALDVLDTMGMELFTGTPQEHDWIELLFEEIEKTQPDFFAASQ